MISLKELSDVLEEIEDEEKTKKKFIRYMMIELKEKILSLKKKRRLINYMWKNQYKIMDSG